MMSRNDKKAIDPEELMRKKFRAKCQFRALGRMVIANAYWLIESVDHYEGVDDVKRRVVQAVRGKAKKKQLLSINDKALLNKPAEERTDHEKKYIYRIIGGLKCFKRYPNHVKKKLAAATYFKYYGPNRVIVRQNQEAHALYFVVTGDVIVSQMVCDELLQQNVNVEVGVMHSGDMFGEVSLLHNIPRTATCTTSGHCEFLALMKEDFKNVLLASIQKQWDEVLQAMSAFTYFDQLDEVARREGCIVARMKSFAVNETILGDGQGVLNFVYFVLSGRCQMIENLQIEVVKRLGRDYYKLYDPYVLPEESEQDIEEKYFDAYKNLNAKSTPTGSARESQNIPAPANTTTPRATTASTTKREKKASQGSVSIPSSILHTKKSGSSKIGDEKPNAYRKLSAKSAISGTARESQNIPDTAACATPSATAASTIKTEKKGSQSRVSMPSSILHTNKSSSKIGDEKPNEVSRSNRPSTEDEKYQSKVIMPPKGDERGSVRYSNLMSAVPKPPPNRRTFFMQVCQMNPGSTFGLGENMRDRRIVALTPVDCMLMPKIWLMQRNTANIWTRIQYFLDKKIPDKKKLFQEFVSQRRWDEYRNGTVEAVMAQSSSVNYTTIHDVPYSIRITEKVDI